MRVKTKALLAATALAGSLAALPNSASATFLNNWYFCVSGGCNSSNYATGTLISEYLDLVGPSYVQTSVPSGGNFTFNEWGAFGINYYDGGSPLPTPNYITATFTGAGTGTLGGSISFTPGSGWINVYSDTVNNYATNASMYGADDGTQIAQFLLVSGGGSITPTGVPNGAITLVAQATMILPGYFFTSSGVDLSTLINPINPILFGFTTVNASRVGNPAPIVVSEIVNQFAGDPSFANTLPVEGTQAGEMVFGNNGQFRVSVPEPASLALLGLGLAGMGLLGRRKRQ